MNIYLVRHGETAWNKVRKLQGSADVPLNEYGILLAEITAKAMKDIPVEIIYSSPLSRALQTAKIMQNDRNIPIITDDRLIEMNFGDFEGASIPEALNHAESQMYNFLKFPDRYVPVGGETFVQVIERADSFIKEVLLPLENTYENVMITAHGALIRCFIRCLEERPIGEFWQGVPQKNCAVTHIVLKQQKLSLVEEGKLYYEEGSVHLP